MYSPRRLTTPPPPSQFRRPWSPDDPSPSTHPNFELNNDHDYERDGYAHTRREPSDISVEALDLADYARALRRNPNIGNPYPPFQPQSRYHPPGSPRLPSPDSIAPPSLVSDGRSLSSQSHAHSSSSRRPFSLPPPARPRLFSSPLSHSHPQPYVSPAQPEYPPTETEIDVGQFPSWSRNWYNRPKPEPAYQPPEPYASSYPHSIPPMQPSPFDPDYTSNGSHPSYPYSAPTTDTHRNVLPWSADTPESGPPLDAEVKEERIRMLQREFGSKGGTRTKSEFADSDGKPLIGTVDHKGRLVTQGPKKRVAVRILQIALALGAAIPSIYVALGVKVRGVPPPASKPPAYTLYVVSVLTSLFLLYLFAIRPQCSGRRSKYDPSGGVNGMPGGMMVLPVGDQQGKKGKKGKKSDGGRDSVQVNLIVDPGMFGGGDRERDDREYDPRADADEYESDAYTVPGTYSNSRSSGGPRKRPRPRRSIFASLAQENAWREARSWLKKLLLIDICGTIVWAGIFVFILLGKRCPSGAFGGWCNGYNVATAAACLLSVAFGLSTFFDIKDLHASRVSPRTR